MKVSAQALSGGQLSLGVNLRDEATLDNYIPAADQSPLIASLEALSQGEGEAVIFLHGPRQTGKSHLLQACCQTLPGRALYLPLRELRAYDPDDALAGLESMALLCIDDVDVIAGERNWEQALFNLFNACRASGCSLLLAARQPPTELPLALPDLVSRLAWGPVFALPPLDDERRQELLVQRAALRGLSMPREVASYLISRAPRGATELVILLEKLDKASLEAQRKLSIPFVKATLGL